METGWPSTDAHIVPSHNDIQYSSGNNVEMHVAGTYEGGRKRKYFIYGIIGLLGLVMVATGVVFALPSGSDSVPAPAPTGGDVPTIVDVPTTPFPTSISGKEIRDVVDGVARFGGSEFDDESSYQSKALRWIMTQELPSLDLPLTFEEQVIQAYALACIYFSTFGVRTAWTDFRYGHSNPVPGWFGKRGWVEDAGSMCEWYGIECNSDGFVEAIELATNGLTGVFPPEVTLLKDSLTRLDLYNNIVHNKGDDGNAFLGELTNLKYLFYGFTSFEYPGIPTEIGLLTNLIEYDMSYTLYFGEIPTNMWSQLTALKFLVMDGNAYNSSLPEEIVSLPNLEFLYAGFSALHGNLDFISRMPKIGELWVDDNPGMSGSIPSEIGDVSTLQSFSITNCDITGTIPTEIGSLTDMTYLWFYDNLLTGPIPSELGNMKKLETLNLQKNYLTGEMPAEVCTRTSPLFGRLTELEADCDSEITCPADCCTCCGEDCIGL